MDVTSSAARSELLRQMGRFDEAVAVMCVMRPDGYNEVKASMTERLAGTATCR